MWFFHHVFMRPKWQMAAFKLHSTIWIGAACHPKSWSRNTNLGTGREDSQDGSCRSARHSHDSTSASNKAFRVLDWLGRLIRSCFPFLGYYIVFSDKIAAIAVTAANSREGLETLAPNKLFLKNEGTLHFTAPTPGIHLSFIGAKFACSFVREILPMEISWGKNLNAILVQRCSWCSEP